MGKGEGKSPEGEMSLLHRGKHAHWPCFHSGASQSSWSFLAPLALFQMHAASPRTSCSSESHPIRKRLQVRPCKQNLMTLLIKAAASLTKPQQPTVSVDGTGCFPEETPHGCGREPARHRRMSKGLRRELVALRVGWLRWEVL